MGPPGLPSSTIALAGDLFQPVHGSLKLCNCSCLHGGLQCEGQGQLAACMIDLHLHINCWLKIAMLRLP